MDLRYRLDDLPPFRETTLFGLQWLGIAFPAILIIGRVVGILQFPDYLDQILFLQKTCFVMALTMAVQILWGHRLPLVSGPAAVMLIGAVASAGAAPAAVYTAIFAGGLLLAILSATGIFNHLQKLFSPRVVAAVLLLIALTLTPTILRLLIPDGGASPLANLLFAMGLLMALFIAYGRLGGLWRSTLIVWGLVAGTIAYAALFGLQPRPVSPIPAVGGFLRGLVLQPVADLGVLLAFLFCFLALSVNDLGSIQSIGSLLRPPDMPARLRRGITLTGLGNALSGLFGVLGPVNFSISPGVVAATGCASRYTILPAALVLLVLSFFPAAISLAGLLPDVVIGSILLYILTAQVAAGLDILQQSGPFQFRHGLILGLPLLLGTIIAFLPPEAVATFPPVLRPVLGNGFVVGTGAVLLLEHLILKDG
ncbi:MAG: solute carrier family 23 protein [Syntrophotaleaceae bacterium]